MASLHMAADTSGVSVTANTALDNKVWDCAGRYWRCALRWLARVRRVDSPYTTERRKLTELASAK
jgi:hypothetical protein